MPIAFVDGRVVVGNRKVLESASVLVEGNRIAKIASRNFKIPKGCRRISLKGGTLLPGFIDAHVHLTEAGLSLANGDVRAAHSAEDLLRVVRERAADLRLLQWPDDDSHGRQDRGRHTGQ